MRNPSTARTNAALTAAVVLFLATQSPNAEAQTCGLSTIESAEQFDALSVASVNPQATRERSTKFVIPVSADDGEALPLSFQNVNEHALHFDFLVACFPDRFSSLGLAGYQALVERRATRTYYAGVVSRIRDAGEVFFGFDVITARDDAEILTQEEIKDIYLRLREGFQLTPLKYAPELPETREAARGWDPDPELPVHVTGGEVEVDFIPYTKATGYGWVHVLSLEEFEAANSTGQTTFRDILVLERAPRDIEGVVAGIITAEPQGELSHLSVRTARRGTPNAFVRSAITDFASLEGKLIRLDVGDTGLTVAEIADVAEAEAFWESNRPQISALPTIDETYDKLDSFVEMDLDSDTPPPESRYGGKASNLARLQRFIDPQFKEVGFAIPMHYYLQFLRSNRMASRTNPAVLVTYEEGLKELLADPEFQSNPAFRAEALDDWRDFVRDEGEVDSELVARLVQRVEAVFGDALKTVRFRSSSNVEDALEFNGAGLYESTSVCPADGADFDDEGPSLCDVDQPNERTIERALKKVWSSLWTFRAFEERAFFGIPQDSAAMGILVNRRFKGELANGVAFTGNPSNRFDRRYVVVVQDGEDASVVSPEPGEIAEKNVLEVDSASGELLRIIRETPSSLLPAGQLVLTDEQLREVAFVLWQIDQNMPVDLGEHAREEVLLDIEFKEEADGTLAFKQVRPFLTADPGTRPPTFAMVIPEGTELCGVWTDGRPLADVHALQSRIQLKPGRVELPTAVNTFVADFITEVVLGPDQQIFEPAETGGLFSVNRRAGATPGTELFALGFEQVFQAGDRLLTLSLKDLEFVVTDGVAENAELVLDQDVITWSLSFTGDLTGDRTALVRYGSCTHEILPLNTTFIDLAGGHRIEVDDRYRKTAVGSAPADFTEARLMLGDEERVLTNYWDMVYAALRHNERVQGWFFLEPPAIVDGLTVSVVQVDLEDFHRVPPLHEPSVRWLDANLQELGRSQITRYCRLEPGTQCALDFRRGDTNGDGRINLVDVIHIWENLFLGERTLECPDAADFDDQNGVDVTDPVLILNLLFRKIDLSAPPGPFECGPDPTADTLAECTTSSC